MIHSFIHSPCSAKDRSEGPTRHFLLPDHDIIMIVAGRDQSPHSARSKEVALSRVLDSLDSYGDICVNRNPEMCTTGSAFLLIVSLFRLLVCFNQRFEGTSCIPILIWTLLQPISSNYSHTYITNMAVTSSKFAKNSGELRHSFCGAFLCLLFAFLQVESVGRWVDRGQCHCSTHMAGYSPLSPFINTLTYCLSSFPLTTMLAQRKSRSRRQSRRFSPNHKSRPLQ